MDDDKGQHSGGTEATPPGSVDRSLLERRMANLRGARTDAGLDYLLYESASSRRKSSRRPWVITAVATCGVLVLASALVFLILPGSGAGSAATQPSPVATSPTAPAQAAIAYAPTSTRTAAPTPTITRPTPAAGEGAVSGPLSAATPPAAPPAFVSPVQVKPRVTDGFGASRGDALFHAGVDVISTTSAEFEIVAACDGTVVGADRSATYADFVVVDCGNSWRTVYAQMSQISARPGQSVTAGASVLGRAQGFLHFEIRWGDIPTNPVSYIDFNALPPPSPTPTSTPTGAPPVSSQPPAPSDPSGTQPSTPPPAPTVAATPTPTPIPPTAVPTPTSTPTPRAARRTATPPPASQ